MATVGFKGLTTNNFSKPQRSETCELITVRRYEWLVLKLSTATSRERRRHRCVVKLSWRTIQTAGQYYVHNAALIREAQLVWTCEHNLHAVMLNEAKTSRPRPRPKIIIKKWQIMINNIWLKIIVGKINKIPEFYTIFARKIPDYIIRQRDRGQAEAEASRPRPRPRPKWPRVFNITAYTSIMTSSRTSHIWLKKSPLSKWMSPNRLAGFVYLIWRRRGSMFNVLTDGDRL